MPLAVQRSRLSDPSPALPLERGVQPLADGEGQRKKATVTVQLDGLARGIHHHFAVMATARMRFDGSFQLQIEVPVQIVRDFPENILAVQRLASLEDFAQLFPQAQARPEQPGFDRADGKTQHLCRLLGGQTLHVAQQEYGAKRGRQLLDGFL